MTSPTTDPLGIDFHRANPYHDDRGRFTSKKGGSKGPKTGAAYSAEIAAIHKAADQFDADYDASQAQKKTLTKEQTQALNFYCQHGYEAMNGALRGTGRMTYNTQRRITDMNEAFKTAGTKTTEKRQVWRGFSGTYYNGKPGDVITEMGYMSTSANHELANQFAKGRQLRTGQKGTVSTINVPASKRFLFGQWADAQGGYAAGGTESEMIFPPGTQFRIDKVDRTGHPTEVTLLKKAK